MSLSRATTAIALLVLASCGESSTACGDGTYCPPDTTCGGAGVCLVDREACAGYADGTPCLVDPRRGHCFSGACAPGVLLITSTVAFPGLPYVEDIVGTLRGHPEVLPGGTNRNGFFDLADAPQNTAVVIDVDRPGALPTSTTVIQIGNDDLPLDGPYGEIPVVDRAYVSTLYAAAGLTAAPGRGIVVGMGYAGTGRVGLAGVEAALTGVDCAGPFYLDATLMPIGGAQATTATGLFAFAGCTPGRATLTTSRSGAACHPLAPAPPGPPAIDVEADRLVYAGRVVCP